MAGVAGKSGRRPKPLDEHLERGTYRRDRHAHLLPAGRSVADARAALSRPVAARTVVTLRPAVEGLPQDESGDALATRLLATYGDWSEADLVVLRLIASTLDRLRELQSALKASGVMTATTSGPVVNAQLLRAERQTTQALAALLRQLNLQG